MSDKIETPAITPDVIAAMIAANPDAFRAAFAVLAPVATAPTAVTPAVKSFNPNAVAVGGTNQRGEFFAVVIGCGAESGIFPCATNYLAYKRALSVVELVKSRGGKFARGSNGKDKRWQGQPSDDKDTVAANRYICYMTADELAQFTAQFPAMVAELYSGMDGRGALVNVELAEAANEDTPGRKAVAAAKEAQRLRDEAAAKDAATAPTAGIAPPPSTKESAVPNKDGAPKQTVGAGK